jgi:hypothetical protein
VTIRSIARVAAQRNAAASSGNESAPAEGTQPASIDRLAAAVPTDVIVLYTTVLGVLASSLTNGSGIYLPLRWSLYGGCLLAILVSVPLTYRLTAGRSARLPVAETVTALWAFAVWGLVVPASPLYVVLHPPTLPVVVGSLTAVGLYVLTGVLGPLLDRPARPSGRGRFPRRQSPPPPPPRGTDGATELAPSARGDAA